jgi:hypothetical protein
MFNRAFIKPPSDSGCLCDSVSVIQGEEHSRNWFSPTPDLAFDPPKSFWAKYADITADASHPPNLIYAVVCPDSVPASASGHVEIRYAYYPEKFPWRLTKQARKTRKRLLG